MNYELPVSKNKFAELQDLEFGTRSYVLFKLLEGHDDTLFLYVHGNEDGLMLIGNSLCSTRQVLQGLIKKGIAEHGIKEVYTISCYGGKQLPYSMNGITIQSMHKSANEIHCKALCTLDDEYFLDIYTDEKKEEIS